jgi:hypothetical protein
VEVAVLEQQGLPEVLVAALGVGHLNLAVLELQAKDF